LGRLSAPADILPVILADRTIPALLLATANPLGTFSTLLQWTMLPRLGTILGSDLHEPSCLCHGLTLLSLCLAARTIASIRNGIQWLVFPLWSSVVAAETDDEIDNQRQKQ